MLCTKCMQAVTSMSSGPRIPTTRRCFKETMFFTLMHKPACYAAGGPQRSQSPAMFTFLMHGAVPFACDAVAAAPDAHHKLHAVALLTTCLQRMKECLEVRPQSL